MRFKFRDGDMRVEALVGERSIRVAGPEIDALRERSGQAGDVLT